MWDDKEIYLGKKYRWNDIEIYLGYVAFRLEDLFLSFFS